MSETKSCYNCAHYHEFKPNDIICFICNCDTYSHHVLDQEKQQALETEAYFVKHGISDK